MINVNLDVFKTLVVLVTVHSVQVCLRKMETLESSQTSDLGEDELNTS